MLNNIANIDPDLDPILSYKRALRNLTKSVISKLHYYVSLIFTRPRLGIRQNPLETIWRNVFFQFGTPGLALRPSAAISSFFHFLLLNQFQLLALPGKKREKQKYFLNRATL